MVEGAVNAALQEREEGFCRVDVSAPTCILPLAVLDLLMPTEEIPVHVLIPPPIVGHDRGVLVHVLTQGPQEVGSGGRLENGRSYPALPLDDRHDRDLALRAPSSASLTGFPAQKDLIGLSTTPCKGVRLLARIA